MTERQPLQPLVAAIIPAYNASVTIDETLWSVRRQTYSNLEIIVVDDGSTDNTGEIVQAHAQQDSRVCLLRQANAGVAAARNAAIAASSADLIAPVDADDLWHPHKIAKQVDAIIGGGDRVGLVYTWSLVIDHAGKIVSHGALHTASGDVLSTLCRHPGLVGNSSSPLIRRRAILDAGGYACHLRTLGAEGCEDASLYFAVAERYDFAVVPEFLTGYRLSPTNMSSGTRRMARSWKVVTRDLETRHPNLASDLSRGTAALLGYLYQRARSHGSLRDASALAAQMFLARPRSAVWFFFVRPFSWWASANATRAQVARKGEYFLQPVT